MELSTKTAIVTGAGSGIGRATALALGAAGAYVVAAGRTQAALDGTVATIAQEGGQALAVRTDVTSEHEVHALFQAAEGRFGPVALLVTAAGICPPLKPVTEVTLEEWDEGMAVNARGTFLCVREAARSMRATRRGHVITISSMVGQNAIPTVSAYGASKAAVLNLTHALAAEMREFGVQVHAICPGPVDTPMRWKATPDFDREKLVTDQDVVDAMLFLVTRRASVAFDDIVVHSLRY